MWERRRGVSLLGGSLTNPVTAVFWFVVVGGELGRLLMVVVAVMVGEMRAALHAGEVCTAVTVVMRMWGSPYLHLLRPPRRCVFWMGEAVGLVAPVARPLLRVGGYPCTLVGEVAVVAPPADIVVRVMGASLAANLHANRRRRSLTGGPR